MSRIGKLPVPIPARVKVQVQGRTITAEGPKGRLTLQLPPLTSARLEGDRIVVERQADTKQAKAMHGLGRALVNNLVRGVAEGYRKRLEIQGVGFRAAMQGNTLTLSLGYSHPVIYPAPEGVKITVEENTKIVVEGPDKQQVGQVAAQIRSFYPPEPYKGKGIRYEGEQIIRKEGKTAQ
ncbi:MAG: 50S ribosomal protein L6 [Verrucomicrobiota bacterium]|nr:50S ribosomal protein L6 [Limisphaera sp.]MDW8382704.1 50S ribosomal protein L6 [Verrucomicrobiota bacterium]